MRFEPIVVALLAGEVAAKCKPVSLSNSKSSSATASDSGSHPYPTGPAQPGYPTRPAQPGYPTGSASSSFPPGYPTLSVSKSSSSGYPIRSSSSFSPPRYPTGPGSSSSLNGYPTGSSSSSTPSGYPIGPGSSSAPSRYPTGSASSSSFPSGYPIGPGSSSAPSGYPTGSVSSSSSPSGYPGGSSSSSSSPNGYPTSSSSTSSTISSTTSSSSSACPTPTDFVVGPGGCQCSYDFLDGYKIEERPDAISDANSFEECLERCDATTTCISFSFQSGACNFFGSRVNDGVTAVEHAGSKVGSLILGSCHGTCTDPSPLPDYEPPIVEDPSICETTFVWKPVNTVVTILDPRIVTITDSVTATTTEITTTTPTELTTTTVFTTETATVTESQATDTYTTTSTEYSTSTEFHTITGTITVIRTVVSSVQPPTRTVSAPAGFTPIKSALPGIVARSVGRLVIGRSPRSRIPDCPVATPTIGEIETYASHVACKTTSFTTLTTTVATSTTTETITDSTSTSTETSTSTIITTTTEVPIPAETTSTVYTTEVITTETTVPTTRTVTITTTSTATVGPTPTAYRQCQADNLASKINGKAINFFIQSHQLVGYGFVSEDVDCCDVCRKTANCGGFKLLANGYCQLAKTTTCNGALKAATIGSWPQPLEDIKFVGNGACGQVRI
ncbi:hypothetical protein GGS23DRAFT_284559 [Durotheca rogersii]|uniref:uncharacterized protein n=1 Tax=Durotheca rogersii TaxID=419775 RepID=UPI00222111B7|nr:uncharacterized protein GGS23DRAFT_284559 [Durotheca rogersii]KAI5866723.1 hypothetical protein GGS23DRAFT_284559 [Durotheca rogersii]